MGDIERLQITEEEGNYERSSLIDPTLFQKIQKEDLDLTKVVFVSRFVMLFPGM